MRVKKWIQKLGEYTLEASYTVEAAVVMTITLFLIAALLTEAFRIHSRVASDMVLQDVIEQVGHIEEGTDQKEILERMNRWLKKGFRCGDMAVAVEDKGERIEGTVSGERGAYSHEISVNKFDPERFLRILRAIGI